MWFEDLTGFKEETPEQVRANLVVKGTTMTSLVNGRTMACGRLETPSLAELRTRTQEHDHTSGRPLTLREVVADVQQLHTNEANAGALFQVASQFNLLEMISPDITPEQGVAIYENDRTQGPACAIAAGAGTIYRNYFAVVHGRIGQTADNQIDGLSDVGEALGNTDGRLWVMRNGYALPSRAGLTTIAARLKAMTEAERDAVRQHLRIGIQWDTQVTLNACLHTVTQAYCSALPVAYTPHPESLWAAFARLVLEASYEATLHSALLNRAQTGNRTVFLTLLGGGVFGNHNDWIFAALQRTVDRFAPSGLDIAIVSYGTSNPRIQEFINAQ